MLNGQKVLISDFISNTHHTRIENEVAEFLKMWYSDEGSIEVKTSGSTGHPKIIRLDKEFMAQSAQRTLHFFRLEEENRVLLCLPVKYIAGKMMIVRALIGKLDLHLVEPETDFSFLQQNKFRFVPLVPQQIRKILKNEPSPGLWMKNIDVVLLGGTSVPHAIEQQLKNFPVACYSGYGMTETASHIALRKINGNEANEYYHCLDRIDVGLTESGCLKIFIPGCQEQPLLTTDLAELKDYKTFRILGRNDHVIISGGIKFSPEQLEKKLEPFITDPFLISSLPHESLGEQLILLVEGKESAEYLKRLQHICQRTLEKYENPRHIRFVEQLPHTNNGKISRKVL